MTFSQEHWKYSNHVSTIQALPITLPTSTSARRRAATPVFHPTTLCLILTIASTYFIALFKQSEATSSTTTHPSELTTLAYLSFLFSMLGTLSGALSTGPVPRTRYQDQPAFVESPGRPASANNAFLLGVMFRLTPPRRLIQRMWDFPMICAFSSLMCFIAQVWLYICIYEPCSVQVVGGLAAASALVAFRRLRTSPRFIPWTDEHP